MTIKKERQRGLLPWLNLTAFIVMIAVNALASWLPLNGVTTQEVSDAYPNLFTPAEITFSVWGLIYLLLLAFTLYQAGTFKKYVPGCYSIAKRFGPLFILSSFFNITWVFCWHYYLIGLSLLCMLGLLVTLGIIYAQLARSPLSREEVLFVQIPFSTYFGWINIATIANVSAALIGVGWKGFGLSDTFWTVVMLLIGMCIGLSVILFRRDPAYGLILVWAYIGIFIKHVSTDGFVGAYPAIIWTAALGGAVLLIASVWALIRKLKRR